MNSRRNIVAVAIIALIAGLFATTLSVMADFDPVPVLVPSGVYTGVRVPPAENPFMMTVIPMDPAGNTLTTIYWSDMDYPNLGIKQPPFSECDSMTRFLGNMVRTGPTTWTGTAIAYGTKKVEGRLNSEPVWLMVEQLTHTFSEDGNTVLMESTGAIFLPEQDKDGDSWPDEDEVPFWCGESPGGANTAMRVPTAFPWEPTPPPPGRP
jgi:hypothetical protein